MLKTYKYRIYPTNPQQGGMKQQLELHRRLYNAALEQRIRAFRMGKPVNCFDQIRELPNLKKECPEFSEVNQSSLGQTLRRLDKAYLAFFRRVKTGGKPGFPRFRTHPRFNCIEYGDFGDGCQIRGTRLYLQYVGTVKVKWHRELPYKPKTLSIIRRNGKWYVHFIVECPVEALPPTGASVGIDMGLTAFLTMDTGEKIQSPKYLQKSERKLRKAQQKVSRRVRGSRRRGKAVGLLGKHHEHISNQRRDFAHKISRNLVNRYDFIAAEDLNIKGMVQSQKFSKSIHDASWRLFLDILSGKAESAGRIFVKVDPRGTSQTCSGCGNHVPKSLSVRVHHCPHCGLTIDRDINAAKNILQRARIGPSALTAKSAVPPKSRSA